MKFVWNLLQLVCRGSGWKLHVVRVIAWTRRSLAAATVVGAKQQMGEANLEMTRQMKNAGLQTDGMVRYATMAATSCGVGAFKKFADDRAR